MWDYGKTTYSLLPILFVVDVDRIVKKSEFNGGVKIGDRTVQRLLSVDALNGLQKTLDRFSDECCVAEKQVQ